MTTEMLTAKEVAEQLNVSAQIVYRLFNTGKLGGHTLAKKAIRFTQAQVDAYLASTVQEPGVGDGDAVE